MIQTCGKLLDFRNGKNTFYAFRNIIIIIIKIIFCQGARLTE